ncbi:MAG: DNA repair protein RecN [Bacillota bacterium]|nr:DNA repair protein RecN [Bacillota bacterium]
MLLQLNISNFALIEKLSVSFEKGFNVLSGETGAGKSILIDAINFVLGGKFSRDFIRTGESRAYVEAIFAIENEKTLDRLNALDIPVEDVLIVSRETFQSGKSVAKVNGKAILVSQLKTISQTLLDIHGQHENQNLLDSLNHINYLDAYGENEIKGILNEFKDKFSELNALKNRITQLSGNDGDREKLIDFLKYQIDEINSAKLKINEDEELQKNYAIISNSENISNTLGRCYHILYNSTEDNRSIYDSLSLVIKELRSIEKHTAEISDIAKSIEEIYYILEQNISDIRRIKESVVYDEKELEYINSRIYEIDALKRKYAPTIDEILKYKDKIENQYNEIVNSSEIIAKLNSEYSKLYSQLFKIAEFIHNIRCEVAKQLEQAINDELKDVGLGKSVFRIETILQDTLTENGADKINFLISTNPGEPLKPLEKVVSGGELSRIMLVLKSVFADKDKIPSIIFDEIDTGISGRIAQSVGEKMYSISNDHQVFCVTHLPQIACISDVHYSVSKISENDKTYTVIKKLNNELKEYEIAKMIGGDEVTNITLEHAKELIKMADNKKIHNYSS